MKSEFESRVQTRRKILTLREQILAHCYIYYHLGDSIIEDWEYDNLGRKHGAYEESCPLECREAPYSEMFKDFGVKKDGSACYSGGHFPFYAEKEMFEGLVKKHFPDFQPVS